MSENARAVLAAAAKLTDAERAEVVSALLLEMDGSEGEDPVAVAEAWNEEARRRAQEIRSGAVRPVPLSEVLADGEQIINAHD